MSLSLSRKELVFVVVGLFIGVSIVPVSSFSIGQMSLKIDKNTDDVCFNSTFPYPMDDIDTNKGLSEIEDFDRDVYEKCPWHYDECLRNQSEFPFDKSFFDYPEYEKVNDIFSQRFDDKYTSGHTVKNRKPTPKPNYATGKTWYVDDDEGADFTKIQDAIDTADDGDTIFVYSGFYQENLVVDISIILQGEDRDTTIVDGGGIGDVIYVSADWVNIIEFTITNSGYYQEEYTAGIKIYSNNNVISNNTIINNDGDGIYIRGSSYNTIFFNHIINNNVHGVTLDSSSYNEILNNNFSSNGICIFGDDISHWNTHTIENNSVNEKPIYYFKNNKEGGKVPSNAGQVILANCEYYKLEDLAIDNLDNGVQLGFSSYNTISHCDIKYNVFGLILIVSSDNVISENAIANNENGIDIMHSSNNNTIKDNNITGNNFSSITLASSFFNEITENEITNNSLFNILLISSSYNVISDNYLDGNDVGILLILSPDNNICRSNIRENSIGILLWWSSDITIRENSFISNGIFILGSRISDWNTHTIENNAVNGKPLCYFKNDEGCTVPSDAGQVILANCQHFTVQNLCIIDDVEMGIQIGFSSYNTVSDNIVTNNSYGIYLHQSHDNTISENNLVSNYHGNFLEFSSNNTISNNLLTNNYFGIKLRYSSKNNIITNNTVTNNEHGVQLFEVSDNLFIDNFCISNFGEGIIIYDSSENEISSCMVSSNLLNGIYLDNSSVNIISNCTIQDHRYSSGILLENSDDTIIRDCCISSNMRGGIKIDPYSTSNSVFDCLLIGNSWGIDLTTSKFNKIEKSTIANNIFGGIHRGRLNIITKTNFIDNYNHYYGKMGDKNVFLRNYWSGRLPLPVPYRVFNLNFDWLPKTTPYDYHYLNETIVDDSSDSAMDLNEQNNRFTLIEKFSERVSSLFSRYDILSKDHRHVLNQWRARR